MKVNIKKFRVDLAIKNRDIVLEVKDTTGNHLGDLHINKARVIWCPGKASPENGNRRTWNKFIELMESAA